MKVSFRLKHLLLLVVFGAICMLPGAHAQVVVPTPTFETVVTVTGYGTSSPGWRVAFERTEIYMINPYTGERTLISSTSVMVYLGYFGGDYVAEE